MRVLRWLLHVLLRCHHRHLTRVFTIRNRTYQVCIECGSKLDYSWELMHSVQPTRVGDAYGALNNVSQEEVPLG